MKKNNISGLFIIASFIIFLSIIIAISVGLTLNYIQKDTSLEQMALSYKAAYSDIYNKMVDYKKIPFKKIPVIITVYNPTKKQCGNNRGITHSGLKITKPERWIALSPDLLKQFPHLSQVILEIPLAPQMSGIYIVTDKTSNRLSKTVDILISNPHQFNCHFKLKGFILYK